MRKITFEWLKEAFGKQVFSASQLSMQFAVKYPLTTTSEIVSIFKTTLDKYKTREDCHDLKFKNLSRNAQCFMPEFYSTFILQNLYVFIKETKCLDQILKSRKFINQMKKLLSDNDRTFRKNYKDQILADKHEILSEFIELIEDKNNGNSI